MILSTSTWLAIASDSFVSMKPTNQKTETTLAERPSYLARRHVLLMLSPIFSRADIIIFCILYYLNHSRMLELSWLSSKTVNRSNGSILQKALMDQNGVLKELVPGTRFGSIQYLKLFLRLIWKLFWETFDLFDLAIQENLHFLDSYHRVLFRWGYSRNVCIVLIHF